MSTHPHIDRICAVITVLALLLTLLFMNGKALGLEASSRTPAYENTLFDASEVHTIDLVIDDWDAFLKTATSEEYAPCSVIIDGEAVKNVAIRGKGNTSLSTVAAMDSERYSFKLEFDHYETGKTYQGLDKLCLNNLIQDNTCMKDYLAYRLMAAFGVDAPLCSFSWITVNGEDWGLYLAVEAVEDSFMARVYNGEGELYKPDSMSMGGGPGNGRAFNMEDFLNENADAMGFPWNRGADSDGNTETTENDVGFPQMPESNSSSGFPQTPADNGDTGFPGLPSGDSFPFSGGPGGMTPSDGEKMPGNRGDFGVMPEETDRPGGRGGFGGMPGGMGMGSGDVKLQYSDDDPKSYSNIFNNAKSDVTDADKARLIHSLKTLSEGENLEDVLDIDEILRYFVVHNYLVNSDSYTGAMVHNYYLHEAAGRLSMIPWDYNLAFGTFQSSDAASAVNDPIDTPLSVSGDGSRPMADWIFQSEEYTAQYHALFSEFLDTVNIGALIDETFALIAPYVEKDPTAFCSYDEFEAGVAALRSFCEKRTESVRGQLSGTIPSTDEGQQADSSALVDASALTLSDMGSMGGRNGGFGGGFPTAGGPSDGDAQPAGAFPTPGAPFGGEGSFGTPPDFPQRDGQKMDNNGFPTPGEMPNFEDMPQGSPFGVFASDGTEGNSMAFTTQKQRAGSALPMLILSVCVLIAGITTAILYKKRS